MSSKNLIKKRKKRTFLLVEALVAISLLFGTGFAFFEIESAIIKKSTRDIRKAQAEIAYQAAMCELIIGLYEKKFANDINREHLTSYIDLEGAPKWRVQYQFKRCDPPEPAEKGFLIDVTIKSLLHTEWGEFLSVVNSENSSFKFCMEK